VAVSLLLLLLPLWLLQFLISSGYYQAEQFALLPKLEHQIHLYSQECLFYGYITLLNTANAVTQASTRAIGLDRNSMQWRTNRFHVAAEFGKNANYFVIFNENQKPEEVTDDIKKIYARSY